MATHESPPDQRIHAAIDVLRGRAAAATAAPWVSGKTPYVVDMGVPQEESITPYAVCYGTDGKSADTAAYIALVDPGVGLLLAELLHKSLPYALTLHPERVPIFAAALALADYVNAVGNRSRGGDVKFEGRTYLEPPEGTVFSPGLPAEMLGRWVPSMGTHGVVTAAKLLADGRVELVVAGELPRAVVEGG